MQAMYELFAPNLINAAPMRKYRNGDIFDLFDSVAVVMSGVVAVDYVPEDGSQPITLRLAGEGQIINLESVLDAMPYHLQYVCESSEVVISVISTSYFKQALASKDPEAQNAMSQTLLTTVMKHYAQLVDTIIGLSATDSRSQLKWALKRYQDALGKDGEMVIRKERLACHVAIRKESVSRTLKGMEEDGLIRKSRSTIRLENQ